MKLNKMGAKICRYMDDLKGPTFALGCFAISKAWRRPLFISGHLSAATNRNPAGHVFHPPRGDAFTGVVHQRNLIQPTLPLLFISEITSASQFLSSPSRATEKNRIVGDRLPTAHCPLPSTHCPVASSETSPVSLPLYSVLDFRNYMGLLTRTFSYCRRSCGKVCFSTIQIGILLDHD